MMSVETKPEYKNYPPIILTLFCGGIVPLAVISWQALANFGIIEERLDSETLYVAIITQFFLFIVHASTLVAKALSTTNVFLFSKKMSPVISCIGLIGVIPLLAFAFATVG